MRSRFNARAARVVATAGLVAGVAACSSSSSRSSGRTAAATPGHVRATVYVVNHLEGFEGSVSVFPATAGAATRTVPVGRNSNDVAVAPVGTPAEGTVYVTESASDTLDVIPPGGSAPTTSIPVTGATDVAVAPYGTPAAGTVYVTGDDGLSVVPPGGTAVSRRIPIRQSPFAIAVIPAGAPGAGTVYVTASSDIEGVPGTVSVVKPGATAVSAVITLKGSQLPDDAVAGPDGAVYVQDSDAGIFVIRGAKVARTIQPSAGPYGLAVAPAGTPAAGTLYVSDGEHALNVYPPGAATPTSQITTGNAPQAMAIAPASTTVSGTLFVANYTAGTVSVIPPGSAAPVRTIAVGKDPLAVAITG